MSILILELNKNFKINLIEKIPIDYEETCKITKLNDILEADIKIKNTLIKIISEHVLYMEREFFINS